MRWLGLVVVKSYRGGSCSISGHSTEDAFRKIWQWGSSHALLLSPVSIISLMSYTHHYFNTIRFRKRGGRRLGKLQNSAPSVWLERRVRQTDRYYHSISSFSQSSLDIGTGFSSPSNSIFPCQCHITITTCSIHLRLSDRLIRWTCGRRLWIVKKKLLLRKSRESGSKLRHFRLQGS